MTHMTIARAFPSPALVLILTSAFAAQPIIAADASGFAIWKGNDLKAYEKTLAPKIKDKKADEIKSVNQDLGNYGNHRTLMNHREGNGEVEVHADWNDLFVIQSGEATLVIGGTVVNPKTTGPGEIRGTGSTGGEKYKVGPGDIVHIPFNVPHQVLIEPGKQVTYFAVKIPAAK
jgi:mannose-6-phosphate isomerase-like protein (cupin superfamily)